jgi:hypothetical protein
MFKVGSSNILLKFARPMNLTLKTSLRKELQFVKASRNDERVGTIKNRVKMRPPGIKNQYGYTPERLPFLTMCPRLLAQGRTMGPGGRRVRRAFRNGPSPLWHPRHALPALPSGLGTGARQRSYDMLLYVSSARWSSA